MTPIDAPEASLDVVLRLIGKAPKGSFLAPSPEQCSVAKDPEPSPGRPSWHWIAGILLVALMVLLAVLFVARGRRLRAKLDSQMDSGIPMIPLLSYVSDIPVNWQSLNVFERPVTSVSLRGQTGPDGV